MSSHPTSSQAKHPQPCECSDSCQAINLAALEHKLSGKKDAASQLQARLQTRTEEDDALLASLRRDVGIHEKRVVCLSVRVCVVSVWMKLL